MRIRKYKRGDEYIVTPNKYMLDWYDDKYFCKEFIETGNNWTIVDDKNRIQAVVNVTVIDYSLKICYGFFIADINANFLYISKVKEIIKKVLQNGYILFTISEESYIQDKMHKFLGFKKVGHIGGMARWVRL